VALLLATLSISAATVTLGRTPAGAGDVERYVKAHRAAVKYRKRSEDLQRRLTARVMENLRIRRALKHKIAITGAYPLERAFLCIHSHEGSWTDRGAPYYGGLQFDRRFMEMYGPEFLRAWGTADRWPVSVQITVAIRAYLSGRRFGPWPLTSRMCGL
jgi:hypothetical protein